MKVEEAVATEANWRAYVRGWLEDHRPVGAPTEDASPQQRAEFDRRWIRELHGAGLAAPQWPREVGGLGVSVSHEIALHEEFLRAGIRWPQMFYTALNHAGRAIIEHGTPAQRVLLDDVLQGRTLWCQAFSEPDAGSDLASLRTRAIHDGDDYVVTGQKVWASNAEMADRAILLARTSTELPRHRGISVFLLRLDTPGVEIRPIRQMTGDAEFSEIFLDEARVPVTDRLGPENGGWAVVHTVLSAERGPGFLGFIVSLRQIVDAFLHRASRSASSSVRPLEQDPVVRAECATILAEAEVLSVLLERVLRKLSETGELSPESSVIKLYFSELHRRIGELAVRMEGLPGQLVADVDKAHDLNVSAAAWMYEHLRSWRYLLGAGTSEIQRNHISEGVLGLPKEPPLAASTKA